MTVEREECVPLCGEDGIHGEASGGLVGREAGGKGPVGFALEDGDQLLRVDDWAVDCRMEWKMGWVSGGKWKKRAARQ